MNSKIGAGIPGLNLNYLNSFILPIPPLLMQNKIVEILDNFNEICEDLNNGLPAEINARQKQYEYYRNSLLTFKKKGQ